MCAGEVLPSLLADAIRLPGVNRQVCVNRALEKFLQKFWRSTAVRLMREMEGQHDDIRF